METGDGFALNGAKTYISNGGIADFYVVFARTGEAPGAKGVSAFILDADTPGLDASERIAVIAPHPLATLKFNDMPPAARRPARRTRARLRAGDGHARRVPHDRRRAPLWASPAAPSTRRRSAPSRANPWARTLADNAIVQSMLAEMVLDVDASALLVYRSAWVRDVQGRRNSREAALAKLHATDSAQR